MSKLIVKVEHVSNYAEIQTSRSALQDILETRLKPDLRAAYLWDNIYCYVRHEDWGKIFKDVLLNMPKYTSDKFDCENFAMLVSARVSEKYRLNTCGIAIGEGLGGRHGFNIFLSESGLFYLEPQTGDVYSVFEDNGYKAEMVIFG